MLRFIKSAALAYLGFLVATYFLSGGLDLSPGIPSDVLHLMMLKAAIFTAIWLMWRYRGHGHE